MGIPLFPSLQLEPSLSLSLPRSLTCKHTCNHRPLPLFPYALVCPVPFAKKGGNPPGAHSSWPCWPPVVNDALGDPKTCGYVCIFVCVCGRGQRRNPTFPLSATHPWRPATRDPWRALNSERGHWVRWKCLRRERPHVRLSLSWLWAPYATPSFFFWLFFFYWGQFSSQRIPKNGDRNTRSVRVACPRSLALGWPLARNLPLL